MSPLRSLTIAAFIATFVSCKPGPSASPITTEPRNLFNGQTLEGWSAVHAVENTPTESVWSVRDGLLICTGEPMGYLASNESFTHFKLVVEWRWAPEKEPGNSGIFLRVNGEPRPLPRAMEIQLKSGDAGHVFGFHGMKLRGKESRMRSVENHELGGNITAMDRIKGAEAEPGEWNSAEITMHQGNLNVSINGTPVNEATDCEILSGPIALQSEGGEIHFRKVTITPLE